MIPVFDGHNDLLTELYESAHRAARWPGAELGHGPEAAAKPEGHLDLARMRAGGFVGGFFAIWVPSVSAPNAPRAGEHPGPYEIPMAAPVSQREAMAVAMAQAGQMHWMAREVEAFHTARSGVELRQIIQNGGIAGIMHMEGVEALDEDLDALPLFYEMGLRSLGPVWSRNNAFGDGVPFSFPSSPDVGNGLSEAGQRLVKACDEMGILIDLSHLNEKGFDDVARLSSQPLIATHSNAHALCPSPRNLTDRQLAVIAESGGVVGLNFAAAFLDPNGFADFGQGFDMMLRHLDHLLGILGEDGVVLGSDFDGARVPDAISDVAALPDLLAAMAGHGFGEALIRKIASETWLSKLETWLP